VSPALRSEDSASRLTMEPICIEPDGTIRPDVSRPLAVLPGSFNPLHAGHLGLARAASLRLGVSVAFELSAANVDKPELSHEEVERRVKQFVGLGTVWITQAATFELKADLFPGAAFILGHDTAVRLIDVRYYAGEVDRRDAALRKLLACNCKVVVGGRLDASGQFRIWTGEGLSSAFAELFLPLSESDFRLDVSSTRLRMR
jgi:hypothetical protein